MSTAEPATAPLFDGDALAELAASLPPQAAERLGFRLAAAAAGTAERPTDLLAVIAPGAPPAAAAPVTGLVLAARQKLLAPIAAGRQASAARLADLRAALAARNLTGFLVPLADEHQGEYIPPAAQRLAWLTGFGGSAGLAVVLAERAAIFVDGRYTLQVRDQVDTALFEPHHLIDAPPSRWLAAALKPGDRLGFDPWLHTQGGLAAIERAVQAAGAALVAVAGNPIDAVWRDRPPAPLSPMQPHPVAQAGEPHEAKIARLAAGLAAEGLDAAVISAPDGLAWLLNVRGLDVPNNPLSLGFAILEAGGEGRVRLFTDPAKVTVAAHRHLGNRVSVEAPADLGPALDALGAAGARVRLDQATAALWLHHRIEAAGGTALAGLDPCALPRAVKNPVEIAGSRAAHVRDGAAIVRFLQALDADLAAGAVLDEIDVVARLQAARAQHAWFRGPSFDTIAGAGPNGAIVHYRATPETSRVLAAGTLLLLDSGAQYPDGTTDVTRTLALGTPSPEHRDRYTLVLKGHLALGAARFPAGTSGSQLDVLARAPLWQAGLDYDHGTGHGVGSFLCVHEGPQRISKMPNTVALQPGMIVSNEPGYYKTGAYGIRIENLIAVTALPAPAGAERDMLGFETLTLVPYDRRLIDTHRLSAAEIALVNAYHARVLGALSPLLDGAALDWLKAATAPISP
ncbi:aminopeptidase P family protein [Zavarzinia compransoris]|uniref:X-Pro aminopeptidase n=1 Tax=Zavarzinia compransoris TaxID=1264899 RepID=A0A317E4A3_9PROT|nr:aminopeptidase P family protein [Zavarzinia compransoris]PWR19885.1 X-Pro aminopeptidase [Zavarzinia compransoris]TDP45003.1 Xaa-Pro aminopeptidase [Zavarzinia compransoris]